MRFLFLRDVAGQVGRVGTGPRDGKSTKRTRSPARFTGLWRRGRLRAENCQTQWLPPTRRADRRRPAAGSAVRPEFPNDPDAPSPRSVRPSAAGSDAGRKVPNELWLPVAQSRRTSLLINMVNIRRSCGGRTGADELVQSRRLLEQFQARERTLDQQKLLVTGPDLDSEVHREDGQDGVLKRQRDSAGTYGGQAVASPRPTRTGH